MQRIGQATARAFKALAGVDRDEPATAWVFALYCFLFLVALALLAVWLTSAPG